MKKLTNIFCVVFQSRNILLKDEQNIYTEKFLFICLSFLQALFFNILYRLYFLRIFPVALKPRTRKLVVSTLFSQISFIQNSPQLLK